MGSGELRVGQVYKMVTEITSMSVEVLDVKDFYGRVFLHLANPEYPELASWVAWDKISCFELPPGS